MSRSGRTTRMLAKAEEMADRGLTVHVFAASVGHMLQIRRLVKPDSKIVFHIITPQFDWQRMQMPGIGGWQFVDHWAIESQFAAMLKKLHEFDQPEKKNDRN